MADSCIETFDDYYNSMKIYYETWTDPILLAYNSLYHMGAIYTSVEIVLLLIRNQGNLS